MSAAGDVTGVKFYQHQLGDDELESVRRVLATDFLTMGPATAAWERELGAYLVRGREAAPPEVVGTSSCTMGLLLALKALGVKPGDEVITTPITFVATASAILHAGGTPVLVDVEPGTGLLDPTAVEAAITPRTVGLIPVHLYGQLADMRALRALADKHHLFVLEDSAHGVEMERDGVRPGELGDAVVFSFYATKNLTSGDGGAVATPHAHVAAHLRRLRNHGVSKSAAERHGHAYAHWDMVELGYKANLSDIEAALLRAQLPKVEAKHRDRERVAARYHDLFAPLAARVGRSPLGVPFVVERRGRSSHHLFTVHAPTQPGEAPGESRDRLLSALAARGVGTAVNYRAIHTLTYLRERLGLARGSLPVAEEIGDRTASLPMWPWLPEREQDYVVRVVSEALGTPEEGR
jgi:dTDP-4-amino-4,6-dideoxygalactose transaminase